MKVQIHKNSVIGPLIEPWCSVPMAIRDDHIKLKMGIYRYVFCNTCYFQFQFFIKINHFPHWIFHSKIFFCGRTGHYNAQWIIEQGRWIAANKTKAEEVKKIAVYQVN